MRTREIAIFAIVAILVPGFASSQSTPASSSGTQIKLITPFQGGNLGIGFAVTSRGSGECFSASIASSGRPDAWRCSVGNAIHDPCLQNVMGDSKVMACPDGPWSANVTVITITKPLPAQSPNNAPIKAAMPWAIELSSGQRCTLYTGATAPIAGMRINYGCPGGFFAVGDIDRSQPTWRIFFQGEKSISLDMSDIAVAWY